MLIQYRPQFVEKILTDASGRQFRVVFAVSFVNGEARGRIVSATEINAALRLEGQVQESAPQFCLSGFSGSPKIAAEVTYFTPTLSPYFSLDYLITTQPTRAPSFA